MTATTPFRLNLHAGPGVGKSVLAAELFAKLRKSGYQKVELITERHKSRTYNNDPIINFDQLYIFANQMQEELDFLRSGISIITDSPLLSYVVYAKIYQPDLFKPLKNLFHTYQRIHNNSFDYFIERPEDGRYSSCGRFQQTLAEATYVDSVLYNLFCKTYGGTGFVFRSYGSTSPLEFILSDLEQRKLK